MFIYKGGLPVGYDHTIHVWECRNGCVTPEICDVVEQRMLNWVRTLPGQSRVRVGKVGIMEGSAVNLKRMENE